MQLFSIPFVVFVILGLALFHACRTIWQRQFVFLLLNVVFLTANVPSLQAVVPMAVYVGVSLFMIHLINRRRSRVLLVSCLTLLVTAFLYLKSYLPQTLIAPLPLVYTSVGLSFILFRTIHVLVDTYQHDGPRNDLGLRSLLNYLVSFLSLRAGPIQRYEEYRAQESHWQQSPGLSAAVFLVAASRLTAGYIKLVLVSPFLLKLHNHFLDVLSQCNLAFAGAAFVYLLFVYLNFSGYMDIAIGLGKLFGFDLPENFDSPIQCSSFLDLWSRWHITLSSWFKAYVFGPVIRCLCSRWDSPALLPYFGAVSYFIVFFLLGLWHGAELRYVILGLFFGLGASANKLFEVEMLRRVGAHRYQDLRRQAWYKALARSVALTYFAFAVSIAWESLSGLDAYGEVLSRVSLPGVVVNFLVSVVTLTLVGLFASLATRCWHKLALTLTLPRKTPASLSLGVRALLLLFVIRGKLNHSSTTAPALSTVVAQTPFKRTEIFYERF